MAAAGGLWSLSTSVLEKALKGLRQDAAVESLTTLRLSHWGLSEGESKALAPIFSAMARAAWEPVLEAVLLERQHLRSANPEFVWTGPEPRHGQARLTSVVLEQLFGGAQRSVLLAGYAFDHGEEIFARLHEGMAQRGVEADFYINLKQADDWSGGEVRAKPMTLAEARAQVVSFLGKNWPFGEPTPRFFFDQRVLVGGWFVSLHAKCAVVDGERVLLTSANFTDRGQHRNIEAGLSQVDRNLAGAIQAQFQMSTNAGLFVRVEL